MTEDWRKLAAAAANEKDPQKLLSIIAELNAALESRERELRAGPTKQFRTSEPASNRLLFVDDEPSIRITLPLLLKERGFEVHVAASVPEALTTIEIQKFDVLLSDLNIGQEGASQLCNYPANGLSGVRKCFTGYSRGR